VLTHRRLPDPESASEPTRVSPIRALRVAARSACGRPLTRGQACPTGTAGPRAIQAPGPSKWPVSPGGCTPGTPRLLCSGRRRRDRPGDLFLVGDPVGQATVQDTDQAVSERFHQRRPVTRNNACPMAQANRVTGLSRNRPMATTMLSWPAAGGPPVGKRWPSWLSYSGRPGWPQPQVDRCRPHRGSFRCQPPQLRGSSGCQLTRPHPPQPCK
jgi:hypothetical protein